MSGDDLVRDQRIRRAVEIRAAAWAYVRECGRRKDVVGLELWGQHRWRRDGDIERRIMCDALRDEVAQGVAVVDVWQRFEVSGFIARAFVGATSYGDLYRILRDNGMSVGFRPAEVAKWAAEGKIPKTEVGEIFGIADSKIEAFIAAWLADEN